MAKHFARIFGIALLCLGVLATSPSCSVYDPDSAGPGTSRFALVLSPTLGSRITTEETSVLISGQVLVLDDGALPPSVVWEVGPVGGTPVQNASMMPDPAGNWSATVPVSLGDNDVRVSVPNSPAEVSLMVTSNPGYAFGGPLLVTPDVAYINEPRILTATITLIDPSTDPSQVQLMMVDAAGGEVAVGPLNDNGDLTTGDEIEADGIFTGMFTVAGAVAEIQNYRVVVGVTGGSPARSEMVDVLVGEHLTAARLDAITAQLQTYENQLAASQVSGNVDAVLGQIENELNSDVGVAQAQKNESGRGIWVTYVEGVAGVIYLPEPDTRGGTRARLESVDLGAADYRTVERRAGAIPMAATPADEINSNKAIGIGAQKWDWGSTEADQALQILGDKGCVDTTLIEYNAAGAGSVEDFKNLGDYGVVLIATHGDSFYNGIFNDWTDKFGWNISFLGVVVIHSNMAANGANLVTYEDDLKRGRLVVWGGDYGITPAFVRRYNKSMPRSIVWMGICRGAFNGTMAAAFLSRGAAAYLSFDEYVSVTWPVELGVAVANKLVEKDKKLSDAYTAGKLDPYYSAAHPNPFGAAEWELFGTDVIGLNGGKLTDGSFESNAITQAWEVAGDARTVPGLGASSPTDGVFTAIISTGLGFTTETGTLSQEFCLGENATSLEFDWNFFSEEFLEFVGSEYQDAFTVSISEVDDPANTAQLMTVTIDSLAESVAQVANSFDQGDVYATGWRSESAAIPAALQNKRVELQFFTTDVGDSIYDTAVLIDNVTVVGGP